MRRALPPLRTLLPAEHGAWFMLGLPVALGLLVRPSVAALLLALGALALFLGRPPLRRVLEGQRDPLQRRALGLCLALAALSGGAAGALSDFRFLIPLLACAPLALVALWADQRRAVRSLAVEWAAQGAFAGLTSAMLVAGGASAWEALRAWAFVTLLGGANLAHVRRLLAHARGADPEERRRRAVPVHLAHGALLAASAGLFFLRGGPLAAAWAAWTLLLYGRALRPYRPMPARTLGWREGFLSMASVLLLGLALH